ncbi:MAG: hypothetical protein FWF92_10855 [Oscillospiraceae bacterium]|nr:hypothetical protein [Oscillospiraceae bacterium]
MQKFREAINRSIAFHNGEMRDNILLTVSLPSKSKSSDYYGRKDKNDNLWIERDCYIVENQNRINLMNEYHRQIDMRHVINDDYVPVFYPTLHLGESYCAAMLGADVTFYGTQNYTCSGAKPFIRTKSDLDKLIIDPDNYWIKFIQSALKHFCELADGKMLLVPIIAMDALNLAVELMGSTEAYTAVCEDPELLHEIMEFGVEYMAYIYKIQDDIIRPYNNKTIGDDSSAFGGLLMSVDAYTVCSPEIYKTMGFSYQQKLLDKTGYGYMHMHGFGIEQLLPLTAQLNGIKDYRLGRDLKAQENLPAESISWMRKILGGDKQISTYVSQDEFINGIKNRILPFNTHYSCWTDNIETAEKMIEMAKNYHRS